MKNSVKNSSNFIFICLSFWSPDCFDEFLALFTRRDKYHSHDSVRSIADSSSGLLGSALVSIFLLFVPRVDMESCWESPGEHVRHY